MRTTPLALLMAIGALGAASGNSPPAGGPVRCSVNGYMWPATLDSKPTPTETGTIEMISDGHGKFTSGQMTQHLADDTHMSGSDNCIFELASGTYEARADGAVTNTIVWKLRPGSDPHCGAFVTDSKNLGFAEGARDFRGVKNVSTAYALEDGRTGWVGATPLGFAFGVCEPSAK